MTKIPKYHRMFAEATERSYSEFCPPLNNNLRIEPAWKLDHDHIRKSVAADIAEGLVPDTWHLAGRCYLVARELSYILFDLKIPHAVTIGNVNVDGVPYFTTTLDTLGAEFSEGYVPSKDANAHCWITLPDGSVLDASLAPSIAHDEGRPTPLSFYDAVSIARDGYSSRLEYVPMLTGFHYHFNVVTHPFLDKHYRTYSEWAEHFSAASNLSWWKRQGAKTAIPYPR